MFSGAIIVSILIGKLRKGSIRALALIPFRRLYLIFLSYGIQFALMIGLVPGGARYVPPLLHLISYVLLFAALLSNWRLPGIPLLFSGSALNAVVIFANGGRMPVSLTQLQRAGLTNYIQLLLADGSRSHQLISESTRLSFLGDVMVMPPPYPRPFVFSIGDVLLALGLFLLIQWGMKLSETADKASFVQQCSRDSKSVPF